MVCNPQVTRALFGTCLTALLFALPTQALAQEAIFGEVRQAIRDAYEYQRTNLSDVPDYYASEGSLEFWSSGGLLHRIAADVPLAQYESFNIVPKHIWVTVLADDITVAQFYAEGSYQTEGGPLVPNYMTRATQVFVKEDGKWKVRAAHFSPVLGGAGTDAYAVQN